MANRAQRRREAREAKAQPQPAERRAAENRAKEEEIQRMIAAFQADMPGGSYSALRADAEARYERTQQARATLARALEKNGITPQDLDREYERGRAEGFREAGMSVVKSCYAGICIALHDVFGFGEERCYRALKACDEKIIWALNHAEMAEELLEKTGLTIDWDDPFERVQKKERRQAT